MFETIDVTGSTALSRNARAILPRAIVIESPLPGSRARETARPARRSAATPVERVELASRARAQKNRAARPEAQGTRDSGAEPRPPRDPGADARGAGRLGSSELATVAVAFTAQLLAQAEPDAQLASTQTGRTQTGSSRPEGAANGALLERSQIAYRRAGGEPPLFSDEATLFSVTA